VNEQVNIESAFLQLYNYCHSTWLIFASIYRQKNRTWFLLQVQIQEICNTKSDSDNTKVEQKKINEHCEKKQATSTRLCTKPSITVSWKSFHTDSQHIILDKNDKKYY